MSSTTEALIKTRPDQEPLPRRMQHLPIDLERGYVVPWFVEWIGGKPEFRAMHRGKFVLIMMGRPHEVEWYREGRPATRAEVQESIDSGIGALEAVARQEPDGMEHLSRARKQFSKLLPKG